MQNDRKIKISVGNNRRALTWTASEMLISELWEKLKIPTRGSETLAEYMNLKKAEQDDLKDIGGFVGGTLIGTRRKANNVAGRDIITLDLDNIPAGGTDDIVRRVEALGCGYCIYSTRKHQPAAPRLRVLLPLDRTITAEEYEPIARRMGEYIGLEFADPTTYEVSRLMYWPSCCADSQYVYYAVDKQFVSADGILATYPDWHDMTTWPALPGQAQFTKLAVKQGDPETKNGVVGAFCRTYDIYRAMEELIPGIYEAVDTMPGRYTYIDGSTTGGAVLYDDGKFLYSHHATDPCSGRLVNAFDLVRLHKYADKDDTAAAGTPVVKLPSFVAMCEFAVSLSDVSGLMAQERYESAVQDFEGITQETNEDVTNWAKLLEINSQTGVIKATINNVLIILEHDPLLKGKFALNEFASRGEVLGSLPWDNRKKRRLWDDNDNQGLYWYLEKVYKITGNGKIDGALSLHSNKFAFNDIQNYLRGLKGQWDGTPRLDTLFIDYLGAKDTAYNRAITRKAFAAAVARAMTPGCKFDNMVILAGPQGIGKSTLLDKMSRGWFNDSIRTFEGKEASELLQGVWLVEVSELDAFRKTDVSRIKQFLSLRADRFRAAYGRNVKEIPRSCIFFGTTNTPDFLQDTTGNRRFWPIDTGEVRHTKNVWRDLTDDEIDQLWAEAFMRWQAGEPLFLSGAIEEEAKLKQEEHREVSSREGIVREFLERNVPDDWSKWELDKRRMFWAGSVQGEMCLVPRDRVCAVEVWCEALGGSLREMKPADTREINAIIAAIPEWKKSASPMRMGTYGAQRGFIKK
ncbi:MAG: virulence-associated protein E [Clostridia bacterium]|nr:virulence-associated protein E [Clostridia bacterium]MBQ8637445.1 virulence-associated protein E [Clostridia bacterium]